MAAIKRHEIIHSCIENYLDNPQDAFTVRKHDYIITASDAVLTVQLHGNMIFAYKKASKTIYLSTCGWVTPTTAKILNACLSNFPRADKVCIRRGVMYYGELELDSGTKAIELSSGGVCVLDSMRGIAYLQDNGKL